MRRFSRLHEQLDASPGTPETIAALAAYFRQAPPEDAAWALWLLMGGKVRRVLPIARLREWVGAASGIPDWLVEAAQERVGDAVETLTLLLPLPGQGMDLPLHQLVTDAVQGLADWDEQAQRQKVSSCWQQLDRSQALIYHKLLTGGFRAGVPPGVVVCALAEVSGLEQAVLAHRLTGNWQPTARFFRELFLPGAVVAAASRPYPFCPTHQLAQPEGRIGESFSDWYFEWKRDGIRAQLIKREGHLFLWSEGAELVSEFFPEILAAAARLPDGTVLDGDILCWKADQAQPRDFLERRLSRHHLSAKVRETSPAVFLASDLLEMKGEDVRWQAFHRRRSRLAALLEPSVANAVLMLSPLLSVSDLGALHRLWASSRQHGALGLLLKHRDSSYLGEGADEAWWAWDAAPLKAALVLISAQAERGLSKGGRFIEYTLAASDQDQLVPVAKVSGGLSQAQKEDLDCWIQSHASARFGPVRCVPAQCVFEIAFDRIRPSRRHKSGVVLCRPRILRWNKEASTDAIDTLDELKALI